MYIVDDPMLVLIARFVGSDRQRGLPQENYMRRQVEAIQAYVASYPPSEKEARAIEWVERHAEQYRKSWQRSHLPGWLKELRCSDCPLSNVGLIEHCDIHDRWSELLLRYVGEEITSREYVEKTLVLLNAHKQRLRKVLPSSR